MKQLQNKLVPLVLIAAAMATPAMAEQPLTKTFGEFTTAFNTAIPLVQAFFFVSGLVIFGLAGFDLWKRSQPQGQKPEMPAVVWKLLGGTFCVAIGGLAYWAKTSLFGENADVIQSEGKIGGIQ